MHLSVIDFWFAVMSRIFFKDCSKWSVVCLLTVFACVSAYAESDRRDVIAIIPGTVELSPLPLDPTQETPTLTVLGLNASVLTADSLAFQGGYDSTDWSGLFQAVPLNTDGSYSKTLWDAGSILTDAATTQPSHRTILTASADTSGSVIGMAFESESDFDASETKGLMTPAPRSVADDTLAARVDYLRGIRTHEIDGMMRTRHSLLGAIVNSQAVYVGYPTGNYVATWPPKIDGIPVSSPEMELGAQTYEQFVTANANRSPIVYVGANDGMLHAFNTPIPQCTAFDQNGHCSGYSPGIDAGKEIWAFIPRAVYGNLGNLTSASNFQFLQTVDATPVVRDVFFSEKNDHTWHTILVGGLRLGGRGVYALDVTDPIKTSEASPQKTVLWEFDADARPGISASGSAYDPADLGYTYGQPAIARLANGRWVVLVPSGYFPDCSQPDKPIHCETSVRTPPADFSALFVLDAQTGEVITELKTPTDIDGITSYGLTSPVLGDYNNDQVDDIAFAGDLAGNLWRFDLSSSNPANWKVTLAYRPETQGDQPITIMPRLFPDPATNRFMVVFGTGKYLGNGDNNTNGSTQSVYGIRDGVDSNGDPVTVLHDSLQSQKLSESVVTDTSNPYAGATLRSLTSNPVSSTAGGWYFDLDVTEGERVVVTPTALFNTNTVLVSTMIPKRGNSSSSAAEGSVMAVNALTGGPGDALFSFGGVSYTGARVSKAHITGMLPVATAIGGGKLLLPGTTLKGKKSNPDLPLSFGSPIWRRRSWSVLTQ